MIFTYNSNAKYLTKILKGGYNNINFSLLDIYPDGKGPSMKIQLLNISRLWWMAIIQCSLDEIL